MCGRFALGYQVEDVAEYFGVAAPLYFEARCNIAPSQKIPAIILNDKRQRELRMFRWGLIPSWAKSPSIGSRLINARAETVAEKPAFRSAFKHRRCLIPVSGFYEWMREGNRKHPYLIQMRDSGIFAFAGLWERWEHEGEVIESCTILTTTANDLVQRIHERMPVILEPENYTAWLDTGDSPAEALQTLLRPFPSDRMEMRPVSDAVNNPRNDSLECLAHPE